MRMGEREREREREIEMWSTSIELIKVIGATIFTWNQSSIYSMYVSALY
jgi:hypothetical protein